MKEQNEEKNLEVLDFLGRAEAFFEKNKKTIITIVGAVVVVALGVWAYVGLYANPRQQQAAEEMFAAEQWYAEGDYEKALEGNDLYAGFLQVIDQYGGTKSANLAKFYAGVCELNLGKFDEAIDHLKGYKGRDTFTGAQAAMLLGDAYAEKDDLAEAASWYEKAARVSDNFVTAPTALFKAGVAYIALDKMDEAQRCFNTIKDKYNESPEWSEVDKYIAYAQNKKDNQ